MGPSYCSQDSARSAEHSVQPAVERRTAKLVQQGIATILARLAALWIAASVIAVVYGMLS